MVVLQIINIIVLALLFIFFKMFMPGYFKQKGKNLADKEDIEELTNKIESVKQQYLLESQKINNKHFLLNTLHTNHRNEERASIIEFYEVYNKWLYKYFNINLFNFKYASDNTLKNLQDLISNLSEYHSQLNESVAKMNLLVRSGNILSIGNEMIKSIITFHLFNVKQLLELKFLLEDVKRDRDEFSALLSEYDKNKQRLEKLASSEKTKNEAINDILNYHVKEKLNPYKECKKLAIKFESISKDYLVSIEKQDDEHIKKITEFQ